MPNTMHISQSDIVNHEQLGFDGDKYIKIQSDAIRERMAKFSGKLYMEVGGKFLYDPHAARVLPGFDPYSKKIIFSDFADHVDVLFCLNARDMQHNRQLGSQGKSYLTIVHEMIDEIVQEIHIKPKIVINLVDRQDTTLVDSVRSDFESDGFLVYYRYVIAGYPENTDELISEEGFGRDEYIETDAGLVLVTGAASNSGKMSTCMGQIYLDKQHGIDSGYAKYETFPLWNLELEHPINLAYEAATADINDFNCIDFEHESYYNKVVTNYNRDVEAFPIILTLSRSIVDKDNYINQYHSPTDMGINRAGFAIFDDGVCAQAALQEIIRRRDWYQEMVNRGQGEQVWVEDCERLIEQAQKWFL